MMPGIPVLILLGYDIFSIYFQFKTSFSLFLFAGQAALESNGTISKVEAISLVTTRLEYALGVNSAGPYEVVAYRGGSLFDFESKVVGVVSLRRGSVEIF
jgi:hypothetical protein